MSEFVLKGEVALVTGASRGIGAAIADELAALGATVIGTATSDAGAQAIGDRLAAAGGHGRRLNVNEAGSIEALVDAVSSEFGGISILVNNAGITRDNLLMRMKDEDWQAILDTNLTSVYRASKAVMRGMMKARKGRIVNIASVIGVTGNAGQANYAAAKPFLERWMHEQVGMRGLWARIKREAPRYAKMLPELPRLIHHNLEHGDAKLRRDLAAMLAEQRQTNRLLSMIVWVGVGFVLGLLTAQLVLRLHGLGVI